MAGPPSRIARSTGDDGRYQVQEFDLSRLEGLSSQAITLHLELYQGYVKAVNELLMGDGQQDQGSAPNPAVLARSSPRFAFEWNGMVLHESFFEILASPHDEPLPFDGAVSAAAQRGYGGIEQWQADCLQLASTRGVGWVVCSFDPRGDRLINHWVDLHHLHIAAGTIPVLALDFWEHAWMTDFRPNQRTDYFECLWRQISWPVVEARVATPTLLR